MLRYMRFVPSVERMYGRTSKSGSNVNIGSPTESRWTRVENVHSGEDNRLWRLRVLLCFRVSVEKSRDLLAASMLWLTSAHAQSVLTSKGLI